jgi:hypothetical protein
MLLLSGHISTRHLSFSPSLSLLLLPLTLGPPPLRLPRHPLCARDRMLPLFIVECPLPGLCRSRRHPPSGAELRGLLFFVFVAVVAHSLLDFLLDVYARRPQRGAAQGLGEAVLDVRKGDPEGRGRKARFPLQQQREENERRGTRPRGGAQRSSSSFFLSSLGRDLPPRRRAGRILARQGFPEGKSRVPQGGSL